MLLCAVTTACLLLIACKLCLKREGGELGHLRMFVHARGPNSHERAVARILAGFYHSEEDKENEQGKRSYYRVLEVDCSEGDASDKLREIFKSVFFNIATRVVVEGEIEAEETHCAEVIGNLRELPSLHFTK